MKVPKVPNNEDARLAALASYQVLDTEPEEALDALVAVTGRLLGTPIALVSLVDEHRQWFKARHGLAAPETPRDVSFCGHVVGDNEELVVADAFADERFADNPLVTGDPRVRFYAGVPLRTPEGHVLGTLCAIDHEPRELPESQLQILRDLAQHAANQLELSKSLRVLAEEQQRLAALFEALHDGVVVQDREGAIVQCNHAAERILGLTCDQMRGRTSVDSRWRSVRVDGSPFPGEEHPAMESLRTGNSLRDVTMGVHKPDGSLTWISVNAEPMVAEGSELPGAVVSTFRDQTEEVNARKALAVEQELLRSVLEAIPSTAVFVYDASLRVRRAFGPDALQLLPVDDPAGHDLIGWVPEAQQAEAEQLAEASLAGGQGSLELALGERRVELRFVPLRAELGLAVALDVTERDRMQDRLARQERLVTTGTLAAGVGHEVNNPLSYVIGNLDFALEELRTIAGASSSGRFNELIEVLVDAREGSERIRTIVRGLRAFAREGSGVDAVDLRSVVEISVNMSMHELRPRCRLESLVGHVPPVLADESKLSQVLVNLLVNAAQAFDEADPSKNTVTVEARMEDGLVKLTVRDNGPGIPDQVLPHIFDPFFTTKPTGVGTGLGLAICHNIISALGGRLECVSGPGVGTAFHAYLPVATDEYVDGPEVTRRPGVGRVMLIDDDPSVLRTVGRLLRRQHDIVSVSDPRDALRRLLGGEAVDAIVCDVVMPHVSGDELFRRLTARRPELVDRFAFMSGGLRSGGREDRLDGLDRPVLEKPFDVDALRELVRSLVNGGGPS